MITIRPADQRGHADHGWLNAYHTFSFANYYDPRNMGFRALRVINEDRVAPGQGFGTHAHNDMEIITYVLEGALEHKDSMGNKGVIRPGEVQHMSAGSGVRHSEFNHSKDEQVHLLQIWIMPDSDGITPQYQQKEFANGERNGKLLQVAKSDASKNGDAGALKIHANASLYASVLQPGESVSYDLDPKRHGWLQVARGGVKLNGKEMTAGDGAAISQESKLEITGTEQDSEILLFDLA
jgi:redox-sensitive bicupin YhaK (pirin superfamily)